MIKIYADGADLNDPIWQSPQVDGFTTNPSLMRRAGVSNYPAFACTALRMAGSRPVSFEVLADDLSEMRRQALVIASWGYRAYVKVPVMTTQGASAAGLVADLAGQGVPLNITAVFTVKQVEEVGRALARGLAECLYSTLESPPLVSVFAGRIADAGLDPGRHLRYCRTVLREECPVAEMLWASPRQVRDLLIAEDAGCEIITMTPDLIGKRQLLGKDLAEFSRETVQMFYDDACASGLEL